MMLYCNEMENFNIPVFCQERALRAMLQDPNKYFNYAVQWLVNANVNTLQRLDKKVCKLQRAKIRNRYNQVPHLSLDIVWESDKNQENVTHMRAKRSAFS